jgi:hypothetical protein
MFEKLLAMAFGPILLASVGLTFWILVGFAQYLWHDVWSAIPLLAMLIVLGSLAGQRAKTRPGDGSLPIHSGIRTQAIPVSGPIGLVVTVGCVFVFWNGLPGLRPLVLALAVLGSLSGAALVMLRNRHAARDQTADTSILHLR